MKRLALALALAGCASERVEVTVAPPKVWGDDQVVRALAERSRAARSLAARTWGGDVQELLQVRHDEASRLALTLDVAREAPATAAHGSACGCAQCVAVLVATTRPLPGPTSAEQIRRRMEDLALVSSYELLYLGDVAFRDRRSRATLLRFDLSFGGYVDLGDRRRFVVVAFVVEGANAPTPPFRVYLLSPEWQAVGSLETLRETDSDDWSASLLGSWSGVGLGGSYTSSDASDYRLDSRVETPLQFALQGGPRDPFTFAFAFGPRRRIRERSVLSPVRWLDGPYEVRYELDPGPRTCQALLVFDDVEPGAPVELRVRAFCEGELVAEDQLDVSRALCREVGAFDVACGAPSAALPTTTTVELYPFAPADLLLVSNEHAFSPESTVLVGPIAIAATDVQVLGRGRLLARLFNAPALFQLARRGVREVEGRVLTPDQPDCRFRVVLLPERAP